MIDRHLRAGLFLGWVWLALAAQAMAQSAAGYDPLRVDSGAVGQIVEITVTDAKRNREMPIRVYLPAAEPSRLGRSGLERSAPAVPDRVPPAPVVLFSHGLGGTRQGCSYLGGHWAARGYVGVFLQHPNSDDQVWRDQPLLERKGAMQQAASFQNLLLRIGDVTAILDQLAVWNASPGNPLTGRLDLGRIGMSGHSFGAHTTQAVGGQSFPLVGARWTDARIRAAIMFSPSPPARGDPSAAFGQVGIPWLLMTGTRDSSMIGGSTPEKRVLVYPALPPGGKYELVLFEAEHAAFADERETLRKGNRNPNHHRAILAISTAFWDTWLRDSTEARAWLDGEGPRSVLEEQDRWQTK